MHKDSLRLDLVFLWMNCNWVVMTSISFSILYGIVSNVNFLALSNESISIHFSIRKSKICHAKIQETRTNSLGEIDFHHKSTSTPVSTIILSTAEYQQQHHPQEITTFPIIEFLQFQNTNSPKGKHRRAHFSSTATSSEETINTGFIFQSR